MIYPSLYIGDIGHLYIGDESAGSWTRERELSGLTPGNYRMPNLDCNVRQTLSTYLSIAVRYLIVYNL